jgi:hypothetical protein
MLAVCTDQLSCQCKDQYRSGRIHATTQLYTFLQSAKMFLTIMYVSYIVLGITLILIGTFKDVFPSLYGPQPACDPPIRKAQPLRLPCPGATYECGRSVSFKTDRTRSVGARGGLGDGAPGSSGP